MPTTDEGTASRKPSSCTVRSSDLLQIAQAERGYIATNGHCAFSRRTDLLPNSLFMTRSERDGYSYTLECSGGISPLRRGICPRRRALHSLSNLAIDATMQVHEIN